MGDIFFHLLIKNTNSHKMMWFNDYKVLSLHIFG